MTWTPQEIEEGRAELARLTARIERLTAMLTGPAQPTTRLSRALVERALSEAQQEQLLLAMTLSIETHTGPTMRSASHLRLEK